MVDINIATVGVVIAVLSLLAAVGGFTLKDLLRSRPPKYPPAPSRPHLAQKMQAEGTAFRALVAYYDDKRLGRGQLSLYRANVDGQPMVVPLATRGGWLSLNVPLERARCRTIEVPDWDSGTIRDRISADHFDRLEGVLRATGADMWDDPLYRLHEVNASPGTFDATFSVDSFMNYRLASGLMMEELSEALLDCDLTIERLIQKRWAHLPIRGQLAGDGEQLIRFGDRMTQGGVCVMLAMAHPAGHYVVPVARRTGLVAGNQNLLSLLPQGLHAPLDNLDRDVSLAETVYREFYEELQQGTDVQTGGQRLAPRWFVDRSPALQWLLAHPEQTTQEILCFGLSLWNASYEVGVLLAVHDPAFWSEFETSIIVNWEAKLRIQLSTLDQDRIGSLLRRPDWTPESWVVLIEGLQRLADIAPDRVRLPDLERLSPVAAPEG
jgi:hypothetical protein